MDGQIDRLQSVGDLRSNLIDEARDILRRNDRGGYTVPTDALYPFQWNWNGYTVPTHGLCPFQWNWDSAFVALGFAEIDRNRAWLEIETLIGAQWDDGMIPHIVFHADDDGYFPGADVWATGKTPPTSGITQPPVLASAAHMLHARCTDRALADAQMAAIYPKLLLNHRWWQTARDPHRTGLVAILH
eukprot:gene10608-13604_t